MYEINNVKNTIIQGDVLDVLRQIPSESIDMCITSPPYWGLRDYNIDSNLGVEIDPKDYINNLCNVFDEVYRVLKKEGTLWVNISDSYFRNGGKSKGKNPNAKVGNTKNGIQKGNCKVPYGYKEKSLALIPQRFAIEMSERGWIVRNEIIWHKPNAMPQPVKDRFVNDYESVFLFSKQKKYKFNTQKENITGVERIKRTTWFIYTKPNKTISHIAPFPKQLVEPCILSGSNEEDIVMDVFMGSGTTGVVAKELNRNYIGIELNKEYIEMANQRIGEIK